MEDSVGSELLILRVAVAVWRHELLWQKKNAFRQSPLWLLRIASFSSIQEISHPLCTQLHTASVTASIGQRQDYKLDRL